LIVAVVQKGVDGMAAQPCQNGVNRKIFLARKATVCGINLDTIVDAMVAFEAKKQTFQK
jgi:hypothetical protein